MKKRRFGAVILILFLCVIWAFPLPVHADTGPKPSLRVRFENLGEELCYGTLLSERASTGPQSAWDGDPATAVYRENPGYEYADFNYETWLAFVEYEDADGYFFLQTGWTVSETKEMAWTYYPPQKFKILLYFPQEDVFVSSGICERYAFDSYYTVDMDGLNIGSVSASGEVLSPYRSYNYAGEVLSLLARIVITILIEIAIALLFGFRTQKQILFLIVTNCITQVILNVLLNVANYFSGQWMFLFLYAVLEIFVFLLEALAYSIGMKKVSEHPPKTWACVLYALVANAVSFAVGWRSLSCSRGFFKRGKDGVKGEEE